MKSLLFWIAFPFLIPQALYVRSTAPRFAPAGGPKEGSVGGGEQVHLLAIGDSIIAGVGATELSRALVGQTARALAGSRRCRVSWRALGVSGYDSAKVLQHLVPDLPNVSFDYVLVSVGVNDVTGLTTTRQWRRNLSQLLKTLHARYPAAKIALAGLPPMHGFPLLPRPLRAVFGLRARVFDEIAREVVVGDQNAFHVPLDFHPDPAKFSPDGYHPSEESYVEFGEHMADRLLA
jgi:lysophospholipase L1-like esterase